MTINNPYLSPKNSPSLVYGTPSISHSAWAQRSAPLSPPTSDSGAGPAHSDNQGFADKAMDQSIRSMWMSSPYGIKTATGHQDQMSIPATIVTEPSSVNSPPMEFINDVLRDGLQPQPMSSIGPSYLDENGFAISQPQRSRQRTTFGLSAWPCPFEALSNQHQQHHQNQHQSQPQSHHQHHHSLEGQNGKQPLVRERNNIMLPSSSSYLTASPTPEATPQKPRKKRQYTNPTDASYHCKLCGKAFQRVWNYTTHMETHNPGRARPHVCTVHNCGRSFVRKTDLVRHTECVHIQNRKFMCTLCSNRFSRKDTLRR
jgi:hypothetical protein